MSPIRVFLLAALLASAAGPTASRAAESTPDPTAQPEADASLAIGQPAPMLDVKMKNVDGQDISIAGAAGKKGTLVLFICNHCPWVKAWQGRIAKIGNAALDRGVGVIGRASCRERV